ncbi:MAG: aminotransferase class V-fold PLP-dependent enzyme [Terriglobia bacterium]
MLERREFLQGATLATALLGLRGTFPGALPTAEASERQAAGLPAQAGLIEQVLCAPAPPLPDEALFARNPEAYWAALRPQFLLQPGFLYLNNGTVGTMPLPVLRAWIEAILKVEQMEDPDTEQYPLWGYGPWDEYRRPVADFIGCELHELALVRNATEGLNYVANGLDLAPGDELLTTDEEHPSGLNPWLLKAKRYGIVVKQVELPKPPTSGTEIVELFEQARTPRTRVILASHVTTMTGCVLPVRELAAWARSHGILSLIDGAHAIGMLRVNVKEIGCDFYVSSPHKWLLAPKGCGLLYIRDEVCDRLWSTIATGGWNDREIRAVRLQQFGTTNVALLAGLGAAIAFWQQIGPERITRRIRQLHAYLKQRVGEFPGAEMVSAAGEEFTGGILSVNFPAIQRRELQQWLYAQHRIRIRGTSPTRLRLSTHIYHSFADLDRFLARLAHYLGGEAA